MSQQKTRVRPPHRPPNTAAPATYVTKDGSRMHVYAKPTDMSPIATFVKDGPWWKRQGAPDERHRSRIDAANSVVQQ